MIIRTAVVTISDSRSSEEDISGDTLEQLLKDFGAEIAARRLITDDVADIKAVLVELTSDDAIDLILTTGGTGLGPRDNTPEATLAVIDREVPGIPEAMRRETYPKTRMSMLSRGVCGVRNKTLIVNLPGSPRAVEECFAVIRPVLAHAIDLISGDTRH
jgi:molybdopterin adenylyltransferase